MSAVLRGALLLGALAAGACGGAETRTPTPTPPATPRSVAVGAELMAQADLARVLAESGADLVVVAVFLPD